MFPIREVLRLLTLGPEAVVYPLLGLIDRAPLGACDFSVHLSGETGAFKTAVQTLCQQF